MLRDSEKEILTAPVTTQKVKQKMMPRIKEQPPDISKQSSAPADRIVKTKEKPDHAEKTSFAKKNEGATYDVTPPTAAPVINAGAGKRHPSEDKLTLDVVKKSETNPDPLSDTFHPEGRKSCSKKAFRIIEPTKEPAANSNPLGLLNEVIEKSKKPETRKLADGNEEDKKTPPPPSAAGSEQSASKPSSGVVIKETEDNTASSAKSLELEITESPTIKPGTVLIINVKGLAGSTRQVKDGCAYFGTDAVQGQYQTNDYVVPSEERGFGKRHFVIKYMDDKSNYFLKDLDDGTGTFVKVYPKIILKNNTIISFGNIHFAVVLAQTKTLSETASIDPVSRASSSGDLLKDPKS